ncbi:class I SAM-dependent methyltransferase, partial [Paractinoplanes durhamensis]
MPTVSVWEDTRTFFPLFLAQIEQIGARSVCVVGASDGKFVLPLARRGLHVLAIERDPSSVDGGPVKLPGPIDTVVPGLRKRVAEEGLIDHVTIVQADLFEVDVAEPRADAVWTSCSWHYSINHSRPLADFIAAMSRLCRSQGGVFGAEYMMPVAPRHFEVEHYPGEGQVRGHLPGWQIDWETYTPAFVEAPHVGQLAEHVHRMGLI